MVASCRGLIAVAVVSIVSCVMCMASSVAANKDNERADGKAAAPSPAEQKAVSATPLRIGIIGLDTSHAIAFTQLLNRPDAADNVPGARVVAAYPQGSKDIEASVSRVAGYREKIGEFGVEIVDSIDALVARVDAVMLESNDGRVHPEQAAPVLAAGKPLFVDKPVAGSLAAAIAMYRLAAKHRTPMFTSSALRFAAATQAVRQGSIGEVLGCDTYSPCSLEATHPDLFWYGIHGCESLYTVMGTGCESVTRTRTDDFEIVTGVWKRGRLGTFRGIRRGKSGFGGTAFGATGITAVGGFDGYRPLVVEIVKFFQTGKPPVAEEETLELYAFMEAADESRRRDGARVTIAEIMQKASAAADTDR